MRKISILLLFVSLVTTSFGQTKKAFKAAAEEAVLQKNYYAALKYYNELLEFDQKDAQVLLKSAEAAFKFNAYDVAANKYSYLLDTLEFTEDSIAIFSAAEAYKMLGKYDKATEYYDRYLTEYGNEEDITTIKAKAGKEASVWASAKIKEVDENITLEKLPSDVNSNYSDFGAFIIDSSMYFTSMRYLEENPQSKPAHQLSKLLTKKGEQESEPIDTDFNKKNFSIANGALSTDGKKFFYTVCDYVSESELRCDIYYSLMLPNGTFEDERKLPAVINDSSYTTTHPNIARDPITGNEILYFSSNRPGGKGELDLWYSIIDPKLGYSKPINLSSINTEGNEATPFYHSSTNTLYFSSDGRIGLGGYDVFKSSFNGGVYNKPIFLSAPTNSSYHDMYYTLNEDGTEGLFSTNREGASYIDNELKACCFDIYKAIITPAEVELLALTFDKFTNEDLLGATVQVIDEESGRIISTLTVDTSNVHPFTILENRKYLIVGSRNGYLPDTVKLSTFDLTSNEPITTKLYLEPLGITLDVFTFDAETKEALRGATIVLEDLSDPTQQQIMEVNQLDNDFHFVLDKDKSYRIIAKKNGYTNVSEIIDTRGVTGNIIRKLYLNRFDLGAYLPIALYFDNDEPNPDSKSTASNEVFGNLLNAYMDRKEVFMTKYGKGAKPDVRNEQISRMENFFEGEVRGGYDQFRIFMDGLIQELQSGKRLDMTIRGYASPRFDVKYNLVLAQRRINSVRNDMESYKGGILAPYLKSKQLIITEISYGEELSPPDVIDNLTDERESIYSLRASKQRRVEVVSVISK